MAKEPPGPEAQAKFDQALDDATHEVLEHFDWMGLPDRGSSQRQDLLYRINDALTAIMQEWL